MAENINLRANSGIMGGMASFNTAKDKDTDRVHRVTLSNRQSCSIIGVTDVISFDLNQVLLETSCGMLSIKGQDLHVGKLSVDKGELEVDGRIDSYTYSEITSMAKKGESFFNRLFK